MPEALPADPSADLAADARDLRADVAALAAATAGLAERYDLMAEQQRETDEKVVDTVKEHDKTLGRLRRIALVSTIGLVLDLGLSGWLTYTNHRVTSNQHKLDVHQAQLAQVQSRTSAEVLCPLYGLFLRSYNPSAQPPERRALYEENFRILRDSAAVLDCPPQ